MQLGPSPRVSVPRYKYAHYIFSNIGFNETSGSYTVQQDGVYAINNNIIITNISNVTTSIVSASVLVGGTEIISSEQGFGDTRTIQISEVYYLSKGDVVTTNIGTDQLNLLNETGVTGGFSVYFVKPLLDIIGITCFFICNIFYCYYCFIIFTSYESKLLVARKVVIKE